MCGQRRYPSRPGFTFIELLVVLGILAILLAILVPYMEDLREQSRRDACANNLRAIRVALETYASEFGGSKRLFPSVVYDHAHHPHSYVAFTGPDDPNAFAKDSQVQPNDVTASLWLLVRHGEMRNLSVFVCPSTSDEPDTYTDSHGLPVPAKQRSNFRHGYNLSYSYASPFSDAYEFVFSSDFLLGDYALLADKNPGFECEGEKVIGPNPDAPPFELAKGNSLNHQRAGQNVLFADGTVRFVSTPYCGVGGDNIYTAVADHRLFGEHVPVDVPGYLGSDLGPAYKSDSYLVPTAQEPAP